MATLFHLLAGGILGTAARYFFSGFLYRILGTGFPYGTLVVNLTGCFLVGFLAVVSEEKIMLSSNARTLLIIGFCGAYTTFSTFMLETSMLMKDGENMRAFLYVAASVILGFAALRTGILLAEAV